MGDANVGCMWGLRRVLVIEHAPVLSYRSVLQDTTLQECLSHLEPLCRRFMGPDGHDTAASMIQRHFRGHLARQKHSVRGQASTQIQRAWRNHRLRQQLKGRLTQVKPIHSSLDAYEGLHRSCCHAAYPCDGQSSIMPNPPNMSLSILQHYHHRSTPY